MTAVPRAREARIVVGVDGSESSLHALRWAASFAAVFGAQLEVVISWEYPMTYGWAAIAPDWDPQREMANVLEDAVSATFGDQRPPGMQLRVLEGGAAKVLLDVSAGAMMLVVGSRGHGGFTGLLLGSVSANVAEHSSCPVFVVHGDELAPVPAT